MVPDEQRDRLDGPGCAVLFYVLLTVSVGLSAIYVMLVGLFVAFLLAAATESDENGVHLLGELLAFIFSQDGIQLVWVPLFVIGASWAMTSW